MIIQAVSEDRRGVGAATTRDFSFIDRTANAAAEGALRRLVRADLARGGRPR